MPRTARCRCSSCSATPTRSRVSPSPSAGRPRCSAANRSWRARSSRPRRRSGRTSSCPRPPRSRRTAPITNLEGRTQRLRPVAAAARRRGSRAGGARCGRAATSSSSSRRALRAPSCGWPGRPRCSRGSPGRRSGQSAPLAVQRPTGRRRRPSAAHLPAPAASSDGLRAIGRRPLFAGAAVARTERLAFQRADEIVVARADALRLGIAEGAARDRATTPAATTTGTARSRARSRAGAVRFDWDGAPVDGACTHRGARPDAGRSARHGDQGASCSSNGLMGFFAFMTGLRAQADRPLADAARPEPRRPDGPAAADRRPRQAASASST